jgi:hypothetical protein
MSIANEKAIHSYATSNRPLKVEGDIPNPVLAVPEPQSQAAASQ